MSTARQLLLSSIDQQRPIVLLLGQDASVESEGDDTLLKTVLDKLGRPLGDRRGWAAMLDTDPMPPDHYEWLAERFERRVHPPVLEILSELPWSAVFTSSLDQTLAGLFSQRVREAQPILTASENPRVARSRARPPLYYLFSRAGEHDPNAQPPQSRIELNRRRVQHALPLLGRILDTATSLGTIVVDGFVSGNDWLRLEDLLGTVGSASLNQILWFGHRPQSSNDDAVDFMAMESDGRIVVDTARLGTALAELRALGRLADLTPPASEDVGTVSLGNERILETTPEDRLRVEAVASIVDDSWTAFLPPLGPDADYEAFRRFHGGIGGHRLLVEGIRRGFAVEREFEQDLFRRVSDALVGHARLLSPIIVEGQSGTGKSVALARIVAGVREEKTSPVLYAVGRIPQPEEVSSFCEAAEREGARATLIVCDANRDVDSYDELLSGLRSRGRRVVVLGSQYRAGTNNGNQRYVRVQAPTVLSRKDEIRFSDLLGRHLGIVEQPRFTDHNLLAYLYRYLPPSRPRIGSGLGAEARASEQQLRERGRRPRRVRAVSQIHQQFIDLGILSDYQPMLDDRIDALEDDGGSAGRIIDLVMVAGSLNTPVPVNLLLRTISNHNNQVDSHLISDLFKDLDLFRWEERDSEGNELLILPRLTLEAQLICSRRLGSPQSEASLLVELIGSVRQGIDYAQERQFLLSLLQQIGRDGPRGLRYSHAYADFARKLTELRQEFNVVDANIMLQESAFRRSSVRERQVDDKERFTLLEEARDAVQTALDEINNGSLYAHRRTRQNLLVERAALYGFLTYDRAQRMAPAIDIWSAYQAARVAVRQAVSAADNYYPHDVGLWTPADLFKTASLTDSQQAELAADIYSTLGQVDPDALPPTQRERFESRRMSVGMTLGDHALTKNAYIRLETEGSTAGYFLRARELAPDLASDQVEVTAPTDLDRAKQAADFLTVRFNKIQTDERCLSLLLECRWIAEMRRRLLRGERQPLPFGDAQQEVLEITRALNQAAGESSQYRTRYLEAVLTWLTDDYVTARETFRQLSYETDNMYRGRIFRRHVISEPDNTPRHFTGRIEQPRGEGRWLIRVNELNQTIILLASDFPRDDVQYGRMISSFAIAFNFIGPIADPIRR